jgi:predicted phosphodiesterase
MKPSIIKLPARKLLFAADPHLDHSAVWRFVEALEAFQYDALVIAGDIGTAPTVANYLQAIHRAIDKPVLLVLGNHDFYRGGGIAEVTRAIETEFAGLPILYLTGRTIVELSPGTALAGIDGWADGRGGEGPNSTMRLHDSFYIRDLCLAANQGSGQLFATMGRLADASALALRRVLIPALEQYRTVYVVTHVPPLVEACRYLGAPSEQRALPFFCNLTMGAELQRLAKLYPHRRIKVLCGHTHDRCHYRRDNLEVWVAGAAYGAPAAEKLFTIPQP